MAYEYITKYTATNYTPAKHVAGVFGHSPEKTSITVHHWGAMEDGYRPARFYEIANYLASGNARQVSAHYVVERGKVACLINPADASWANGDAKGNATSISIECNPLCSQEDKETLAELVAELRDTYGKLLLVPHAYWTPTECPGRYDVFEIDRMALAIQKGHPAQVRPAADNKKKLEWSDMATEKQVEDAGYRGAKRAIREILGDVVNVPDNQGTPESRKNNPSWTVSNALTNIWAAANQAAANSDPQKIADAVLTRPVKLRGDTEGTTDLETKIAWQAHEFHRNTEAVEDLTSALLVDDETEYGGKYTGGK